MNGPGIVCAACGKPTTLRRPICDECRGIAGFAPVVDTPYCSLCEAGLAVDKFGQHTTKTGGYAPGRPVHLRLADGTCICPTCRPKLWRYADKPGEQL